MYRCIIQTTSPSGGNLFRLIANCFMLFCIDLSVLVFPTLLADVQRPNWKSFQSIWMLFGLWLTTCTLTITWSIRVTKCTNNTRAMLRPTFYNKNCIFLTLNHIMNYILFIVSRLQFFLQNVLLTKIWHHLTNK